MQRELLTILFIRSSYKIRKINLLFIYYQIIKMLILLFIIAFIVLLTSVIILKRTNNQLKQNIVKLENRNTFLNSGKTKEIEKNDNNSSFTDNMIQFDFRNIISDKIDIQDLKITTLENDAKIDISFKVINLEASNQPAKGYIIIGGFPEQGKISDHIFFPQSVLLNRDKEITNFEKGEPFSIRNFKNEKIALLKPTSYDINNIVISVFSEKGKVISRKVEKIYVGQ